MPVFFFDIDDGQALPDQQGLELADVKAALTHCLAMATTFLRQESVETWREHSWSITVRGEAGDLLYHLAFEFTQFGTSLM